MINLVFGNQYDTNASVCETSRWVGVHTSKDFVHTFRCELIGTAVSEW